MRRRARSSSAFPAAGLIVVVAAACSREPPRLGHALRLADLVPTQERQVSSNLLAVPEGVGLSLAGFGWRREAGPGGAEGHLVLDRRAGRLEIFSADADLSSVRLELGLPDEGPASVEVAVLVNGGRIGEVRVVRGWSSHDIEVLPELVRRGPNFLDLWAEPGRRDLSAAEHPVRLRRALFRTRAGRGVRAGPGGIQAVPGAEDGAPLSDVLMPVASFLDGVVRLPARARFAAELLAEGVEPGADGGVRAYLRVLDEGQREHTLVDERLGASGSGRGVEADLSRFTGQLVRLRWGATGTANGAVRWREAVVHTSAPVEPPALPPIGLRDADRSGRLGRPDVVLILLDAARADAFSPFGGPHPTPALERLARDGTVFTDAVAPASWTGQSVPAILTGHSADALGVGGWGSEVPETVPTLPELAAAAGYRTVVWSQHPFYWGNRLASRFGESRRAPDKDYGALPRASDPLAGDRPTLALVHLIPPHAPYTPPPPFLGAYSSWYSGPMDVRPRRLHRAARRGVSDDDVRYARDRYLENAAFADHLVGRILERLDGEKRYDDALVVVLSDHGEAFHEHGRFLHTDYVHREYLHVPLVIKWPSSVSGFRRRVDDPVSLLDLVPTLVDGLALSGGGEGFMGRDLLPVAFAGASREPAIYAVSRGESDGKRFPASRQMLQLGEWRLLYFASEDESRLYRADEDPGETRDLAARHPLEALRLRQGVLAQLAWSRARLEGGGEEAGTPLDDPEILEQLEALGYVN